MDLGGSGKHPQGKRQFGGIFGPLNIGNIRREPVLFGRWQQRCGLSLQQHVADVAVKSVSMNAAMNLMTINGRDLGSVEKMLRQLTYVNNRLFPTPATRPLTVETHIKSVLAPAANSAPSM